MNKAYGLLFYYVFSVLKILTKMGIYYGERSGKGFKAKLKVSEEELEKYLESWDHDEDLLGVSFFKCYGSENEYVIWCLKYVVENSYKIMRCYDMEDDKANLRSYRDDILDIAYYSQKEGKLLCIDFDESLISQYDKDMTRGTFYPMTLKCNVNPWNDMNVIVETIPKLCGHEDQSKEVQGYIEETKNTLLSKTFVYDIRETISITEANFE